MKKVIVVILVILILFLSGCINDGSYEITEIVCGIVKDVEGNKIFFENDSYSGIVKNSGAIHWDSNYWNELASIHSITIDDLNGYDIYNLTERFVEITVHSVMKKNNLYSTLISLEIKS